MQKLTPQELEVITSMVQDEFKTFGGGQKSTWGNPILAALEDHEPAFAAGVNVKEVINYVVDLYMILQLKQDFRERINNVPLEQVKEALQ